MIKMKIDKYATSLSSKILYDDMINNDKACEIVFHIRNNFVQTDFNVNKLCDLIQVSRQYLYDLTLKHFNQTPSEIIERNRLLYAIHLFPEGYSLKKITYMSGFYSSNTFRKVFQYYFKMNPSEFRAKFSNEEDKIAFFRNCHQLIDPWNENEKYRFFAKSILQEELT